MSADLPHFHQAKILFCSPPGKAGLLVENRRGRRKTRQLTFTDAHAALDWCLAHEVCLVFTPSAPRPEDN